MKVSRIVISGMKNEDVPDTFPGTLTDEEVEIIQSFWVIYAIQSKGVK